MLSAAQVPRNTLFRRAACAVSATATAVGFAVLRRRRSAGETFVPLAVDPTLSFDESLMDNVDWTNQPNVSTRELELLRVAASTDRGRPVTDGVPTPALS